MSKIEALMLVALGFLLALMLVFAFGRSIWTASNLYAKRQREKDMPAAMLELQAERDKLRADNARMARKLEVGTDAMSTKVVTQMAEVSRHRDRLLTLSEQAGKSDEEMSRVLSENSDLASQVSELTRELDAQHKVISQLQQERAALTDAKPAFQDVVMAPANENPSFPLKEGDADSDLPVVHMPESEPVRSPAMSRAVEADEKAGKFNRFNFDRKPLSPSMERTMRPTRQAELKDVIEEARRSLASGANAPEDGQPKVSSDPVLGFAQRIREIQKKSDARLNKTLK
jgi:cell division protein FtsB